MKKIFLFSLLLVFGLFVSVKLVYANVYGGYFGGRILNTEAIEITTLEAAGYSCLIPGSTIEVNSILGPKSFFIPSYTTPVTGFTLAGGQQILGKYAGQEMIVCTRDEDKYATSQTTVLLDIITYFGTSQY